MIATSTIWRLRRKYPGLWAAWLAYGVILLPNVGVIQFSAQITADRYAYLATMPLIVLLAAAVLRLVRRMTRTILVTSTLAGMACLIPLVIVSRQDVMNWQNSVALWKLVLKADDQCAVAAANLGHALMAKEDFAHARPMLVRAIELDPALTIAGVNLGACDYFTRHYQQAIHTLEDALSTDPPLAIADQGKAHATLGACYAALRKDDLAWPHALRARNLGYAKAQQLIDYLSKFSRPPTTTPSSAP